jgi:hypothetical protein
MRNGERAHPAALGQEVTVKSLRHAARIEIRA